MTTDSPINVEVHLQVQPENLDKVEDVLNDIVCVVRFGEAIIFDLLQDCDEDCPVDLEDIYDMLTERVMDEYNGGIIEDISFGEEIPGDLDPEGIDLFIGTQDWLDSEDNNLTRVIAVI